MSRDVSGQLELRATTVNPADLTVEAVLSSEGRVEMFDWRSGEMIEEVLLADGVDTPDQLPMLDSHSRNGIANVLGSIRRIRKGDDGQTIGVLHFVRDDDASMSAFRKVAGGHLTDVSVGYRILESVEVAAGERATVNGREWAASDQRRLRVATKWKLREASLVPIGADEVAKMRGSGANEMAKEKTEAAAEVVEEVRQEPVAQPAPEAPEQVDADAVRSEAIEQERSRVAAINELAGDDVETSLVRKAVSEGWDEARASREFLANVRSQREPERGPAIHSRSHETSCTERSLAAGLLIGQGVGDPTKVSVDTADKRGGQLRFTFSEQDADFGHKFRGLSAVDIMRECVRMDGGSPSLNFTEAFRAAMSGTHLDRVFTTNAYARLIQGWDETPDTTGWCGAEDVPNFMEQEDITLRQNAGLDKHSRGDTAKHADFSDDYETYKAHRFSKKFTVDEQDVIDDRLNAMMAVPMDQAARRVHPDLVYSILLANAALTATGGALFNSTAETTSGGHANLTTAALDSTALKAGLVSMASKRIDSVPLNIRARYLLVPSDLMFTGKELLNSAELRDTTASTVFMTQNVLSGENLMLVVEDRLGASGVTDPTTGTPYTGSAANWFLAAQAGRTVKKPRHHPQPANAELHARPGPVGDGLGHQFGRRRGGHRLPRTAQVNRRWLRRLKHREP